MSILYRRVLLRIDLREFDEPRGVGALRPTSRTEHAATIKYNSRQLEGKNRFINIIITIIITFLDIDIVRTRNCPRQWCHRQDRKSNDTHDVCTMLVPTRVITWY